MIAQACPNCMRRPIDTSNAHGLCGECYDELCLIEGRDKIRLEQVIEEENTDG